MSIDPSEKYNKNRLDELVEALIESVTPDEIPSLSLEIRELVLKRLLTNSGKISQREEEQIVNISDTASQAANDVDDPEKINSPTPLKPTVRTRKDERAGSGKLDGSILGLPGPRDKPTKLKLALARDYAILYLIDISKEKLVGTDEIMKLLERLGIGMSRASLTAKLNKWKSPDVASDAPVTWIKPVNIQPAEGMQDQLKIRSGDLARDTRAKIEVFAEDLLDEI